MQFKAGAVIKEFAVINKKGELIRILFRFPKISLARKQVKWINKMRSEALYLGNWRNETLKTEKKFIKDTIKLMKEKKGFHIIAETNKKIVGGATMHPKPHDAQKHVGVFGIGLLKEYAGMGIGYELGKTALQVAKKHTRFTVIDSSYNSNNNASAALHKKLGFKIAGKIPKGMKGKDGGHADEVILYKKIK